MSKPARYVLHPGLPKTGTTSLQASIWPRSPNYAGWQPWKEGELGPLFRDLVRAPAVDLDAARTLLEQARVDEERPVVVSYESCTWQTFAPPGSGLHRIDGWERVRRLFELFGVETEVVIVVREHRHWLLSAYRFLLELGLRQTLTSFLEHHDRLLTTREPGGSDFAALVDAFADQFGEDRVRAIPLEALLDGSPRAWSAIATVMGLEASDLGRAQLSHDRSTPLGLPLPAAATVNRLRRSSAYGSGGDEWRRARWLVRHGRIPRVSSWTLDRAHERIDGFVRAQPRIAAANRVLAERTGYDLDAYGYV